MKAHCSNQSIFVLEIDIEFNDKENRSQIIHKYGRNLVYKFIFHINGQLIMLKQLALKKNKLVSNSSLALRHKSQKIKDLGTKKVK